ncbi:hypothetical protein KOW79_018366 [Hemibagrus wyckioides]|uniref:V-SNARE coiled-coil homology domain-containing protein n=1 Tax=Hemibagrus wyckioides TaxID=337641 RepID=A0A9D3N8E7_9TELE|nr:hypothetical protein KOW79_018366 [Hemibagrus wyckioides]
MKKGESRLQQLQGDVEETKDIMVETYNKAIERDTKLEDLDERAVALKEKGKQFEKKTRNLRVKEEGENSRMLCRNRKVILIIVTIFLVLLIIIIIVAVYYGRGSNGENRDSG